MPTTTYERISKLSEFLDKQISVFNKIYLLVGEEKELLIKNKKSYLPENIKKQEFLVKDLLNMEEKRLNILKDISAGLNLKLNKYEDIDKLLDSSDKEMKDKINKQINHIRLFVKKISGINNTNIFLINQDRNNIKSFINLIINTGNPKIYMRDGNFIKTKKVMNNLINKVI
jgi:flagellar biosynthesis/type III secretory pathway chaperone